MVSLKTVTQCLDTKLEILNKFCFVNTLQSSISLSCDTGKTHSKVYLHCWIVKQWVYHTEKEKYWKILIRDLPIISFWKGYFDFPVDEGSKTNWGKAAAEVALVRGQSTLNHDGVNVPSMQPISLPCQVLINKALSPASPLGYQKDWTKWLSPKC